MTDVQQLWHDFFCKSTCLGEAKYETKDVYMMLFAQLHASNTLENLDTQSRCTVSQFFAELLEQLFLLRKKTPYPLSFRLFLDENIKKGSDLLYQISKGTCSWENLYLWLNINYMHINHEYIYSFLTIISPYLPLPNTTRCAVIMKKIISGKATLTDLTEHLSDNQG